jgi:alpha-galactosidase
MNKSFQSNSAVKFDLFRRYGIIAAAGDRHLCEFVPSDWYMKDAEMAERWKYKLTGVVWRKEDKQKKIQETKDIIAGKIPVKLQASGEEGVNQMAALAGLGSYVTNVNIPNYGQIANLPLGAVVETNAYFSGDSVKPLFAGTIPEEVNSLIIRHVYNQEAIVKGTLAGDYEAVFKAFIGDPQMKLSLEEARRMYDEMLYETRAYLPDYDKYVESRKN